jgi:hypothetical protein
MKPARTLSFQEFWQQSRRRYLRFCFAMAVNLPLAILAGMFAARGLQCYLHVDNIVAIACADLSHPMGMLVRWLHLVPEIYLLMPIVLAAALYLEWSQYRKDEPSYFTHSKGCEGPPGYTRRLKLVNGSTLQIEDFVLQAEVIAAGHKRYAGDFTEAQLLRYLKGRFARTENKPSLEASDHLQWRIRQNNGNEVGVDLKRAAGKPTTWTLRTEFYQWAGRKSPPTLVETHVTEFVLLQ